MLKINIPESELELLKFERYNHPHPRVMIKMDVVYLKGLGFSNDEILKITGVCGNTMREYWKQYQLGGVERLKEVNFYRQGSDLQEYSETIENCLQEKPPSSIKEAVAIIEKLTVIKRGETQVRKFLKQLGFKHIKTCSIPAKALTEEKKRTT